LRCRRTASAAPTTWRFWSPYFPDEPPVTPAAFKRTIRDLQVWCSSCMVAFSGSDPIGVLIGAKRPSGTLVHKIAVHPDHRGQGHGRHLLASLGSKLAILGPPRMIAEVPETLAAACGLLSASGYVQEALLTDYVSEGPALTLRQAQGHPERSRGMNGPPRSVGRALSGPPPALSGPPTVLFVGSIFNRRHVPELIDGFARLARAHTDARLDIVGENRTSPRVDLVDVMRTTGLADRVGLRSYVSDDELRAIYDGASAFVFLSEYEGFGLTPLEALAAGVPVLLLDTPVARETCGDAAIYVARPDPALIEAALTRLLFDPVERTRILTASQRVLARYCWTDCARQVLDILVSCGARIPGWRSA